MMKLLSYSLLALLTLPVEIRKVTMCASPY